MLICYFGYDALVDLDFVVCVFGGLGVCGCVWLVVVLIVLVVFVSCGFGMVGLMIWLCLFDMLFWWTWLCFAAPRWVCVLLWLRSFEFHFALELLVYCLWCACSVLVHLGKLLVVNSVVLF